MAWTIESYLDHVKWIVEHPQRITDWEGYAYGFLDFQEIKDMELYDLAWELSHPRSGYCSKGDIEGLVELIEKKLGEKNEEA